MSDMNNLSNLSATYTKMKEDSINTMKTVFKSAFAEFFDKWPQVHSVWWTQYTPHFNDGEPCEFGVHEFNFSTNPDNEDYPSYDTDLENGVYCGDDFPRKENLKFYKEMCEKYANSGAQHPYAKSYKENVDFIENEENAFLYEILDDLKMFRNVPEEVFESLGEGLVIVTRNGIEVQEYDHD